MYYTSLKTSDTYDTYKLVPYTENVLSAQSYIESIVWIRLAPKAGMAKTANSWTREYLQYTDTTTTTAAATNTTTITIIQKSPLRMGFQINDNNKK